MLNAVKSIGTGVRGMSGSVMMMSSGGGGGGGGWGGGGGLERWRVNVFGLLLHQDVRGWVVGVDPLVLVSGHFFAKKGDMMLLLLSSRIRQGTSGTKRASKGQWCSEAQSCSMTR